MSHTETGLWAMANKPVSVADIAIDESSHFATIICL